jgi:hypothetical protein
VIPLPAWLNPGRWLLYVAAIAAAVVAYQLWAGHLRSAGKAEGRAEVQAKWDQERLQLQAVALVEHEANARETQRRLARQEENQRAQDAQLAAATRDAARHAADAEQLRNQNTATARQWRDALSHPAAGQDGQAAAEAIGVCADLLGRAVRRAGLLASFAESAHAAGLKCERDYDALIAPP